jgi:hypothetical protein
MSTGMPQGIWLAKFGVIIRDYFGHVPYHVGSSLDRKDWRDVDVRLILPDDEFEQRFGKGSTYVNKKLAAITLAFCALGKQMTGLPIDFQIQPESHANEAYPFKRSALLEVEPPCPDVTYEPEETRDA